MKTLPYTIPTTLTKEKELLIAKCDLLIEAFTELCKEESKRLDKIKEEALANRQFTYSILTDKNGWKRLYKECTPETIVDKDPNSKGQSSAFKIINNVLFYAHYDEKAKSYCEYTNTAANKLIPQGIFDESTLESININW